MRPLTDKQERFCQEYLVDLNATQAAIRAGYSEKTARQMGSENLSKPYLAERIQALQDEQAARTAITADRVLKELALIAFSNLEHYHVDADGNITLAEDAPAEVVRALSAVKRKIRVYRRGDTDVKEVDVELKVWNKNTALQDLARHLGLLGPTGRADDPLHVRHDLGWDDSPEPPPPDGTDA